MKIYIATSFACKEDFRVLKQLLEVNGHTITHDWSLDDVGNLEGEDLRTYLMTCAGLSLLGVRDADAFVLLARPNMAGAFVEMGFAMGLSVPIIVLDAYEPGNQSNIFYNLPQCEPFQHVKSYEDLLSIIAPSIPSNPYDNVVKLRPDIPGDN